MTTIPADLPDPEDVLALAWAYAESDGSDHLPNVYGTQAETITALVELSREIRAVRDWRKDPSR